MSHPPLSLPDNIVPMQKFAAEATHWALYALLIVQLFNLYPKLCAISHPSNASDYSYASNCGQNARLKLTATNNSRAIASIQAWKVAESAVLVVPLGSTGAKEETGPIDTFEVLPPGRFGEAIDDLERIQAGHAQSLASFGG